MTRAPAVLPIALLAALPILPLAPSPATAQEPEPRRQTGSIDDAQPRVTVALSPTELTVGDRVTAVLTVTAPEGLLTGIPRFPEWEATWGRAEILAVGEPETLEPRGGVATFRQRLVLAAFRPGEVVLPPQEVELPQSQGSTRLTTPDDLVLRITPVLPPPTPEGGDPLVEGAEPEELEPKPEAPPHELPLTRAFWWAVGTTACICGLLALLLWSRTRGPQRRLETLTPLAQLERELQGLPAAGSLVDTHAALSRALRRYLGHRLGFPASESTTSEIRREVGTRSLPETVRDGSSEVLIACDLVKFARRHTTAADLRRHTATTRRVGHDLERSLRPPEEEGAWEAGRGDAGRGDAGGHGDAESREAREGDA